MKKDIKTKIGKIHELGLEMGMFISTHNKIFWNLLFNEFGINNKSCKKLVIEDGKYMLKWQKKDLGVQFSDEYLFSSQYDTDVFVNVASSSTYN